MSNLIETFFKRLRLTRRRSIGSQLQELQELSSNMAANLERIGDLNHSLRTLEKQLTEVQGAAHVERSAVLLRREEFKLMDWVGSRPIFNPGIVACGGIYKTVSRRSNFVVINDSKYKYLDDDGHHSELLMHHLSPSLEIKDSFVLDDAAVRRDVAAVRAGMEDARLFVWQKKLWAMVAGVNKDDGDFTVQQCLIMIEAEAVKDIYVFDSPMNHRLEKNWIPLVVGGILYIIYSFDPMIVYIFDNGNLKLVRGNLDEFDGTYTFRGGTTPIRFGQNFLCMTHSPCIKSGKKLNYTHNWTVFTENFEIVETSDPFFIVRKGIEFASGLIDDGNDLLISFGIGDRIGAVGRFPKDKLRYMLLTSDR